MEELEQPILSDDENSQTENVIAEIKYEGNEVEQECAKCEENLIHSNQEGSNLLGKFNDVEELMKAYNNLQAEFTRKCQKLSMLEKEVEDEKSKIPSHDTESKNIPAYMQEDFAQSLTNFLVENPNAKQYSKEISLELIGDESIDLNQAYERVLAKKYREPEDLVQDQDFIEKFILTNENLKKELLKQYVKNVKESTTPHLISGNGGVGAGSKKIELSSLEEANKLALKMFRDWNY